MAIIFLDGRMFIGAIDITCNRWYLSLLNKVDAGFWFDQGLNPIFKNMDKGKSKIKYKKNMKLISYYCEISFIFSISQVENKYKKLV